MQNALVLTATLLAPVTTVTQDPDTARVDVVSLAFAWPVGTRASVDLERVRVRSMDASTDSSAVRVTYDLEVAAHPAGRLIRYANFSTPELTGLSDPQHRLAQAASSIVPSYVVSDAGELLQIHEVSEIRSTLMHWLRQANDGPLSDDLDALMSQLLSEETLLALASQHWNALVGTWGGADLEVGAAYELETEEPLPMLGNVLVPFRYELGASTRLPCEPNGADLDCVELILRSYPDPEALQPHLEAFVDRMLHAAGAGAGTPPLSYKQLSIENEVVVVTEPETLLPHALTVSRVVDAVLKVGGVEQVGAEYQLTRYTFTYR